MILRLFAAAALLVACDKTAPSAPSGSGTASSPSMPRIRAETAVYRPTFTTTEGEQASGTAFAARLSSTSPVLLVTAHHLFGADGGFDREYAWNELPKLVSRVTATSIEKSPTVTAGPPIAIDGATKYSQTGMGGDVAAFVVSAPADAPALAFATARPAEGAQVWLISKVEGSTELRHRAVVAQADDEVLAYVFDNASIQLRATSGAPVVDAAGDVVAINIAGGSQDGKTIGFGNPAWSVSKRLRAATKHEEKARHPIARRNRQPS
jgi:hypothetical protein